MNEKQIQDEVLRYLEDQNYRYALLINGEWGCGKTYFMLNSLKNIIEDHERKQGRSVKYVSVYGCKTVEEIEETIYWSIIDKKFFEIKQNIENKALRKVFGNKKHRRDKTSKVLWTASKKLIGTAMNKFNLNYKLLEDVEEIFSLERYIMVFDDLERSNCPINDMLGYINRLVEHEGVKVILIANEQEIGRMVRTEYKELQYLLAANKEIKVPEDESNLLQHQNSGSHSEKPLTVKELERRRKEIFTETEIEEQYIRLREKLIGVTVLYEPDFASVIHKLIVDSSNDEQLKKLLNSDAQFFIDKMNENNHHNFRTFQFFLSKINYLYTKVISISINENYFKAVEKFVIRNCFIQCIEYKGNIQEPENRLLQIMWRQRRMFVSIHKYIYLSVFDLQEFINEINSYIDEELINQLSPEDPYNELSDKYYIRSQTWNEEKINEIIIKLYENGYPVNVYKGILKLFIELRSLGFPKNIVKQTSEVMINNAKLGLVSKKISYDWLNLKNESDIEECREIIDKINDEISKRKEGINRWSIQNMLKDREHWATLLKEYTETNEFEENNKSGVLNKAPIEMWINTFVHSDPENLFIFRKLLSTIYPHNQIKEGSYRDMNLMSKIITQLGECKKDGDIIQTAQLSWLISDLNKIYKNQTQDLAQFYENKDFTVKN